MSIKIPENLQKKLIQGEKQKTLLMMFRELRSPKTFKSDRPKKTFSLDPRKRAEQATIAKMTNWQRNQWARAGYPTKNLTNFLTLTKETRNAS